MTCTYLKKPEFLCEGIALETEDYESVQPYNKLK